ncbi:MAG: hypothetical protein LBT10_06770 [Methanobrevibacter sp.]|nr:hypothetical protein [Methanobrevibacter sp.]
MNHFILDLVIDKYKISEKVLMFRNIKNLNAMGFLKDKKKIFIFDRGYPSIEFFYKLIYEENVNIHFQST